MNKVKRNSLVVLLLTIILLIFMLKDNFNETINSLTSVNISFLIIAILLFILSYICDALSYYYVVKQYKSDYTVRKAFRLNILTKFFNGITPLASGGQPLQLYELHKDKVKMHDASTIVIQFYVIYQIALVIISTISVIFLVTMNLMTLDHFIKHMLIIGYLINIVILFILFFISFNKRINKSIIDFIIIVLYKLKIVKNKDRKIAKWNNSCNEFHESAKLMLKNKNTLCRGVILQIFNLLFLYTIPLILVYALKITSNLNLGITIIASSFVFLAGCYIPIPGATGGMEYGFYKFFGNYVPKNNISSLIILWRFITYFLPVIIGGIIFNINIKKREDNEVKI